VSIYVDHAATTPMISPALAALTSAAQALGNPSSLHSDGRAARKIVEDAREVIAKSVGCAPSEVIFTGGGTESDNAAIKGLYWATPKKVIVISAIEHHAVLDPAHWLVEHEGAELYEIPVTKDGVIDLAALRKVVAERGEEIALISVMHSNNETGVIQPIREVVEIAGSIPVHSDASQSFTKTPLDFSELGLFAMTLSGHKLGASMGIGALVLKRGVDIPALLHGGGQEREIRSGTLNTPAIASFAAAVAANAYNAPVVEQLRKEFEKGVQALIPDAIVNGAFAQRLPGISNITFPQTENETLLLLMDSEGISCSTGAACTAGVHRPSHVLVAMGHTEESSMSSLRFSFGHNSTRRDVEEILAVLPSVIERGKRASKR